MRKYVEMLKKNFEKFAKNFEQIGSRHRVFKILEVRFFLPQKYLKYILKFLKFSEKCRRILRGVLQKFCIAQPFSACGNTVLPKLHAHVTKGTPGAHAKFRSNRLRITWWLEKHRWQQRERTVVPKDEQQSAFGFLTLENVLGCEFHQKMCMVYSTQNVITKLTVNR